MVYTFKYNIGDMVYLVTDREQNLRQVTGINIRASSVMFCLSCGTIESWHYDFEISKERDILKVIVN